jgi:ribosomal protein S18 acetylase RimI-like enzyme
MFAGLDPARIDIALTLPGDRGGIAFGQERFDSEIFALRIGRVLAVHADGPAGYEPLLRALGDRARSAAYDQVLCRASALDLPLVWALERTGFELMDIGLTFGRTVAGPLPTPEFDDLQVRLSTDGDIQQIVDAMLDKPWGSRYEADPAYTQAQVRELRRRWLWNSHRGRAAAVLIGVMDGHAAGYVTCMLDGSGHGEIELVGTLPAFRGRRVASRILDHAVAWFSTRATRITVRTQATNFAAAALYEKSGFTLSSSDLTLRLSLTPASATEAL